jgi:hypothetical protein
MAGRKGCAVPLEERPAQQPAGIAPKMPAQQPFKLAKG